MIDADIVKDWKKGVKHYTDEELASCLTENSVNEWRKIVKDEIKWRTTNRKEQVEFT